MVFWPHFSLPGRSRPLLTVPPSDEDVVKPHFLFGAKQHYGQWGGMVVLFFPKGIDPAALASELFALTFIAGICFLAVRKKG